MLENFFNPKSIAVIGASHSPEKLGFQLINNLISAKYSGKIYPVNPDTKPILNLPVYASVLDITDPIDLAFIAVKPEIVPLVMAEIKKKNIDSLIIFTANLEIEKQDSLKILGPNCLGLINTESNLNASFSANYPSPGDVSIISQSGALLSSFLDWAKNNSLGISKCISLGNKVDLSENEFLKYLKNDKNTKAIGLYLESFKNGKEFQKIVSEISLSKPVIVLKPGKTKEAKIAVTSHTGALAGSDEASNAALMQSGCIRAGSIEEFTYLLKAFSAQKYPQGPELTIITNAGGPGVIATDKAIEEGLKIVPLSSSLKNPLDVIGDALSDRYESALKAAVSDKIQDAILVILTPQSMTEIEKTAQIISDFSKKTKKPIFASFIGGEKVQEGIKILNENRIPSFQFPENAVSAVKSLLSYVERKKYLNHPPQNIPVDEDKKEKAKKLMQNLDTVNTFKIAEIYEIPTAKIYQENIKYPVVVKIDKPGHKNAIGGVIKNINTQEELDQTMQKLSKLSDKFIVQQQIESGVEVIIGAKKDKDFGHLIMFGTGGIYTEYLKDINFAVSPLSNYEALELVKNTKIYKILPQIYPVIKVILSVSTLLSDFPQIEELDINPLIVSKTSCTAVDIKIKV